MDECACAQAGFPNSCDNCDAGFTRLPLQYEDGPDYCTVKDALGRDFALTVQPKMMQAMEKALREHIAIFSQPPTDIVKRLREMPSSLNEALRVMDEAASYIERQPSRT